MTTNLQNLKQEILERLKKLKEAFDIVIQL